jgi:23S rRNA (adenine2503-C2)-methyltransferase
MRVVARTAESDLASVFVAEAAGGRCVEFVESRQPPRSRLEKWVVILSVSFGCPIGCPMCDAGGDFSGPLSAEQIWFQLETLRNRFFPGSFLPVKLFKIQFARMGEPALNPAVLEVLDALPRRLNAHNITPCISTIAPRGSEPFFSELRTIKERRFPDGCFQLQFSIHDTDPARRDGWIPARKWGLAEIASYGERFVRPGDRKITLNFALAEERQLDPKVIRRHFDPQKFLIKITPVNPTIRAVENRLTSLTTDAASILALPACRSLKSNGYEILASIGELEENRIGSNCGQYVRLYRQRTGPPSLAAYSYPVVPWTDI